MKFFIQADHAPPGKGSVVYLDGKLEGDPAVLEEAKTIKTVRRSPHHGEEPMDWSDGELAGQALQTAMGHAYGGPLRISVDEDSYEDPRSQVTFVPPGT
jgi:hypothetical protein